MCLQINVILKNNSSRILWIPEKIKYYIHVNNHKLKNSRAEVS